MMGRKERQRANERTRRAGTVEGLALLEERSGLDVRWRAGGLRAGGQRAEGRMQRAGGRQAATFRQSIVVGMSSISRRATINNNTVVMH